jgi:hypothetical protein
MCWTRGLACSMLHSSLHYVLILLVSRLASTSDRSLTLVASGFAYYRTPAEALRSIDHFVDVHSLHIII